MSAPPPRARPKPRRGPEQAIVRLSLLGGAAAVVLALVLLWAGDYTPKVRLTLATLVLGTWAGFALAARERVVRPLQNVSNLLAALREGDFSLRARGARAGDALGEVLLEVNALGETLQEQRLGALEATALLRRVMAEIDVVVFAFDTGRRLRLTNRAGERLLGQPHERLLGRSAEELGLGDCLEGGSARLLDLSVAGHSGRWDLRRSTFRQGGDEHTLLVLSDVSRALREEERQAWLRLIRVIGHELNNSLAPIRSLTGSLAGLLARVPRANDWEEDMRRGLAVISARSESLGRFMDGYARLARLPPPTLRSLDIGSLVRRAAGLETRLPVSVTPGPEILIQADGDQIEQLLINLIRNAVDATLKTGGAVRVGWTQVGRRPAAALEVWVEDEGPGLSSTSNLFVPFFTTKQHGSGIGLALSRQIAEAHGGTLTLENVEAGCRARLRLPLAG